MLVYCFGKEVGGSTVGGPAETITGSSLGVTGSSSFDLSYLISIGGIESVNLTDNVPTMSLHHARLLDYFISNSFHCSLVTASRIPRTIPPSNVNVLVV